MAASEDFRLFLQDQLARLGDIRIKRMFGGAGVYCGGIMFALISDETLYLKADRETEPDFRKEGSEPFTYMGKSAPVKLSYWRAPERLLDDADELLSWAQKALEAARRARA